MKKVLCLFALMVAFAATQAQTIKFPAGEATYTVKSDTAGTVSLGTFNNTMSYVHFSDTLDASGMTITATAGTGLKRGSVVYIYIKAGPTVNKTLAYSTGITGATSTLTANKQYLIQLYYNGSIFLKSAVQLID